MKNLNVLYLTGRYKAVHIGKIYTAQTTISNFIANAVLGEVAFVKKSDNTIYSGIAVIPDNTEIYLIKKIAGTYKSYPSFTFKPTGVLSLPSRTATVTKSVGAVGAVPVKRVVVTYGSASDCGGSANGYADIKQVYSLNITFGQYYGVPDSVDYYYSPLANETITSVITKLIDKVNDPYSAENQGKQSRFNISNVVTTGTLPASTTTQFNINGVDYQEITVGLDGFCNVAITTLTSGTQPINDFQNVLQFEKEGIIVDGRYINQFNLPPLEDITTGKQLTNDYNTNQLFTGYQFELINMERAHVAGERIKNNIYYSILFTPTGSDVETKMNTLFGL